jgi:signal peptidase I
MSQPRFDPKKFVAFKLKAKESLLNVLKPQKPKKLKLPPKEKEHFWLFDTLKAIIAAFIIALVIRTFFLQIYYIPTDSMEPTLRAGDRILVNKLLYGITNPFWGADDTEKLFFILPNPFYKKHLSISNVRYIIRLSRKPKRTDIVVFKSSAAPGEITKRIIGLPGEQFKIMNGTVYINGKPLNERYSIKDRSNFGPVKIPNSSYFVLGDKRAVSSDSRNWGAVSNDKIIGILTARIWPLNKIRTFK